MWSPERSILWAEALGDPPSVANMTYRIIHTLLTATIHCRRHPPAYINKQNKENQQTYGQNEGPPFLEMALINITYRSVFSMLTSYRY